VAILAGEGHVTVDSTASVPRMDLGGIKSIWWVGHVTEATRQGYVNNGKIN